MDYIEKALEKLREWIDGIIDALLGPEAQHDPELIPIPVKEPRR
jgi:predicted RNase H-like HicB family nuclease